MKNLPPVPKLTDFTDRQQVAALHHFLTMLRERLMSPTTTLGESEQSSEPVNGDMFVDRTTQKVTIRSGGVYVEI